MKFPSGCRGNLIKRMVLALVSAIFLESCEDPVARKNWSVFMENVLNSAKYNDANRMVGEFGLDESRLLKLQALFGLDRSGAELLPVWIWRDAEVWEDLKYRDAQIFLRSYKELLAGEPARYSVRTSKLKGREMHSVIFWLRRGGAYHGIYISRVWATGGSYRVVEWVPIDPDSDIQIILKKRALLKAEGKGECIFPGHLVFESLFLPVPRVDAEDS